MQMKAMKIGKGLGFAFGLVLLIIIISAKALGVDAPATKPGNAQDLYEKTTAAYDKRNPD